MQKDMTRSDLFVKERVFVRYVPNFINGITDKTHPEYGGLSNNARIGICAPVSTRRINKLFTEAELEILAKEFNDPTLMNNDSDFWKEFVTDKHGMSKSIFPIFLKKEGMMLTKEEPLDFIYIRILEDSDSIATSFEDAKVRGSKFAMIKEKDQFKKEIIDKESTKKAFKLYEKYEDNMPVLRYLLNNIGKSVNATAEPGFIQNEAWKKMTDSPNMFSGILGDALLEQKIKLTAFLRFKLINKVNSLYYFEDGAIIALDGDKNDIDGAAKYFESGIGQEQLLMLTAKLAILTKTK